MGVDNLYILWIVCGKDTLPMGFYVWIDDAAAQMYVFEDQIKEYGGILHHGPFGGVRVVDDMFITETSVEDILKKKVAQMKEDTTDA